MMTLLISLALMNGCMVGLSRTLNGRLGQYLGPFRASFSNHIFGFLLLTLYIYPTWTEMSFDWRAEASWPMYMGGVFGALFVAVNSYVFPRLGSTQSALLVMSGQMLTALFIDCVSRNHFPSYGQGIGMLALFVGVAWNKFLGQSKIRTENTSPAGNKSPLLYVVSRREESGSHE
ncbi:DMT family transporter [bacterium]|jgi:bacterial/archaeal transporter family-2 protein|nr:DMT family transporter [bacterium]